jgi:hypothetical protein
MKRRYLGRTPQTLLLLALVCFRCSFAQQEVTVKEMEEQYPRIYPGITAAYSFTLGAKQIIEVNIMQAPTGAQAQRNYKLCAIPEWISNLTQAQLRNVTNSYPQETNNGRPIGLLVSGVDQGCSVAEQAAMTGKLRDLTNVSKLEYLFVYGNSPDIHDKTLDGSPVQVVYIPLLAGQDMLNTMYDTATMYGTRAYFMESGDRDWQFNFQIQPYAGPNTYSTGGDNFYWFRIVLFTLLIVSPCLRAGYLWFAGGGRFHWRRNDRGRINGIRYVPYVQIAYEADALELFLTDMMLLLFLGQSNAALAFEWPCAAPNGLCEFDSHRRAVPDVAYNHLSTNSWRRNARTTWRYTEFH